MSKVWLFGLVFFLCVCRPSGSTNAGNSDIPQDPPDAVDSVVYINYNLSLSHLLDSLGISSGALKIEIDKSDYRLSLVTPERIVKQYPCVFGGNPVDDKLMQGDMCTPEGEFRMVTKYPHRSWSKFIWINYPTADSWRKHNAAIARGEIPEGSDIGGEVGIHGVPGDLDALIDGRQNWTLGCISLKNKDVNEIYPYITKSTPILITP